MNLTSYEAAKKDARQRQARKAYPGNPLVRTGPGDDFYRDYTPKKPASLQAGIHRRYEQAFFWGLACAFFGGIAMATLMLILNLI